MTRTPGVWIAKSRPTGGYSIVATDDVLEDVVIGTAVLGDFSLEQAHANAHLMAASKRMLAALKRLVESGYQTDGHEKPCECPICAAISVIADVEGTP